MSRVTEVGMDGAQEDVQRTKQRAVGEREVRLHDGTITVSVPDTLWATDATEGWTEEGRCAPRRIQRGLEPVAQWAARVNLELLRLIRARAQQNQFQHAPQRDLKHRPEHEQTPRSVDEDRARYVPASLRRVYAPHT